MLETIRNRRSVRQYLPKPVEPARIQDLVKAGLFAPTAKNLRPVAFVVVQQGPQLQQLSRATPYSGFAKRAPLVIAVCYNAQAAKRFQEDCAMAAENIYLEATEQGLGACYVQIAEGTEAGVGEPELYVKGLLGVPDTHRVLCLMAIGYPEKVPAPHDESEFDSSRIHYEKFGNR